jgi:hypothetical protein
MAKQKGTKLNRLEKELPEGLLVDSAWLTRHGYSTALRTQYVRAGWLEQPTRGVYRRPRGAPSWQSVVVSLQTLLNRHLSIGGRTAIELHGFAHYLSQSVKEVYLYGPQHPPHWLAKLPLEARFTYRNDHRLFGDLPFPRMNLTENQKLPDAGDLGGAHFTFQTWGQWDWPFLLSTPERALLELLDELPKHESFYQVDKFVEGLTNLSPRRMQTLLAECRSVKVKRLFFFFARRHRHVWLKQIKEESVTLGAGKRMLVRGGRLDPKYQITVPEDLDAHQ